MSSKKKKPIAKKKGKRNVKATPPEDDTGEFDPVTIVASFGLEPSDYTIREILYCFDYVRHFNGAKAAQAAGYATQDRAVLARIGYSVSRRPRVVALINELKKERFRRLEMTAEDILAEWAAIARFDERNLYDANGNLLQPHELDDETARCVTGIKVRKEFADREHVADILEYKIIDKNTALTNLARQKGMFKDTVLIEPGEELSRLLDAIDGATVGPPGQRGKDKAGS